MPDTQIAHRHTSHGVPDCDEAHSEHSQERTLT